MYAENPIRLAYFQSRMYADEVRSSFAEEQVDTFLTRAPEIIIGS
jgi:hypothetical protein